MDRKLQAMLHTDDQTKPSIFDGGIRCPRSNGRQHMAMVVVWAVMDLDDDPEDDSQHNSVPRRAICSTCGHDWDPGALRSATGAACTETPCAISSKGPSRRPAAKS